MRANDEYIARLRQSRDSRSVIKTRFVTLKGRVGDGNILVFEGDDDKIIYNKWISRISPALSYEVFVCNGKRRVCILQAILRDDLGTLANNTYLFIDRDYDDDRDFSASDNLFMTDNYSVENYVVSREVLSSIIRDDFPCHESVDLRETICDIFDQDYESFLTITREFNRRLFLARQMQVAIAGGGLPKRVNEYAKVEIANISPAEPRIEDSVLLVDAVPAETTAMVDIQFDQLDPKTRYRGKCAFLFFQKWIDRLVDQFDTRTGVFLGTDLKGNIRRSELSLGAYSARSPLPAALPDFLARIAA